MAARIVLAAALFAVAAANVEGTNICTTTTTATCLEQQQHPINNPINNNKQQQHYTATEISYWMDELDLDWDELTADQRAFLQARGWTEPHWNCRSDEESLLPWNALSPPRQRLWESRGWNQVRWDKDQTSPCQPLPLAHSTPDAFRPLWLQNLSVPALDEQLSMKRLQQEHVVVRTVNGSADTHLHDDSSAASSDGEDFDSALPLSDLVTAALQSSNTTTNDKASYYLHLEEGMYEKKLLQQTIGDTVIDAILDLVQSNEQVQQAGLWNPVWNDLERSDFDWALFLGGQESKTNLHYDSDVFNILYMVQGRKRFVLLPNDNRTEHLFTTRLNEDGGTAWGDYDLLDTSRPLPELAVEYILHPGQALIVPRFCWHAVENLEPSLAYSLRVMD